MTDDSIDDRLKQMRADAEKEIAVEIKIKQGPLQLPKKMELEKKDGKTKNMLDLDQFMESLDRGSLVQIYKKNNKIVIETSPLLSKFLLYSICINVLLFVVLLTKVVGLW